MLRVPLRFDAYTRYTITHPNSNFLRDTQGNLDAMGRARARISFAPGSEPQFVGLTMHHAYILLAPVDYVSLPVSLDILP